MATFLGSDLDLFPMCLYCGYFQLENVYRVRSHTSHLRNDDPRNAESSSVGVVGTFLSLFTADIFTCHSRKSLVVIKNNYDHDVSAPGSGYCACWLTCTAYWNT